MKRALVVLVVLVVPTLLLACSATGRHKALSVLFDGVPEKPGAEAPPPAPAPATMPPATIAVEAPPPEPTAAELAAGGYSGIDELPLRPVPKVTGTAWAPAGTELEKIHTWEEALRLLPLDVAGGVDWVAAVQQGLTVPKLVLNAEASAPFTLDTLLAGGAATPGSPFLDFTVEMTPEENPFFKVEFPHSSHTLFLACSSCHPGVRKWDVSMEKILAGEACGQCHGRVSFNPETSCARCHQNLLPPDEDTVRAELVQAGENVIPASPEVRERGAGLYRQYCAFCHGEAGDGAGKLARYLTTKPRNFQAGTYKFRSTLAPLPTDLDLFRTITRGIPGTSMPAWSALPSADRWALVHYVKTFSDYFEEEKPGEVLAISEPPAASTELVEEGKKLFTEVGCSSCHGDQGRGDGPSAKSLKDNWGQPIRPYNFASGRPMKSGSGLKAVFRVVMTGIGGTPMPAFGQSLTEQQAWALARFVDTFRGQEREPFAVKGDIVFPRGGATNGGATNGNGTAPEAVATADAGGGSFWGDDDDATADAGGGGFWGDDDVAATDAGGGGFWDDDDEVAATDTGAGSFWDDDDEVAATDTGAGGFWGDDDEDVAADAGGGGFWGDDDVAADAGGGFWGDDEGGGSSPQPAVVDSPAGEPQLPAAVFPHWFHRIRFKCANCHPAVFEMKKGANPITMDAMRAGFYCAKCHNGEIAWQIGFTACPKCHQANPGP